MNNISFSAKIQFDNNTAKASFNPQPKSLLKQAGKTCFVGYQVAKNIITRTPIFYIKKCKKIIPINIYKSIKLFTNLYIYAIILWLCFTVLVILYQQQIGDISFMVLI